MAEQAAKDGDQIISDGTSKVWVQQPGGPPPNPISVAFKYEGPIDGGLSSDVLIMGKQAAVLDSTASNSTPPDQQVAVTSQGAIITAPIDNTGTITTGSSSVLINGNKAGRNGDKAKTWDYGTPPAPGTAQEIENASVAASASVLIGD